MKRVCLTAQKVADRRSKSFSDVQDRPAASKRRKSRILGDFKSPSSFGRTSAARPGHAKISRCTRKLIMLHLRNSPQPIIREIAPIIQDCTTISREMVGWLPDSCKNWCVKCKQTSEKKERMRNFDASIRWHGSPFRFGRDVRLERTLCLTRSCKSHLPSASRFFRGKLSVVLCEAHCCRCSNQNFHSRCLLRLWTAPWIENGIISARDEAAMRYAHPSGPPASDRRSRVVCTPPQCTPVDDVNVIGYLRSFSNYARGMPDKCLRVARQHSATRLTLDGLWRDSTRGSIKDKIPC